MHLQSPAGSPLPVAPPAPDAAAAAENQNSGKISELEERLMKMEANEELDKGWKTKCRANVAALEEQLSSVVAAQGSLASKEESATAAAAMVQAMISAEAKSALKLAKFDERITRVSNAASDADERLGQMEEQITRSSSPTKSNRRIAALEEKVSNLATEQQNLAVQAQQAVAEGESKIDSLLSSEDMSAVKMLEIEERLVKMEENEFGDETGSRVEALEERVSGMLADQELAGQTQPATHPTEDQSDSKLLELEERLEKMEENEFGDETGSRVEALEERIASILANQELAVQAQPSTAAPPLVPKLELSKVESVAVSDRFVVLEEQISKILAGQKLLADSFGASGAKSFFVT